VRGLPSEQRAEIERLLERAAEANIERLGRDSARPAELAEMLELPIPRQLAISAAVRAARLWLEADKPYKAYKLLAKIDKKYPPAGTHHELREAGSILAEAGLKQIADKSSFLGFFRADEDGAEILEYLVETYPTEPRCDEAYARLAEYYIGDKRWDIAQEKYEDLLVWHPDSPLAPEAEAQIPRMRLRGLKHPQYDRAELDTARRELESWLERHGGADGGEDPAAFAALEARVRRDLADAMLRLIENDLATARFYRRIDQWDGARLRATRALMTAEATGHQRSIERARALLDGLPVDGVSSTPEEMFGTAASDQDPPEGFEITLPTQSEPAAEPQELQKP
jgi:hypothetical protein